MLTGSVLEDSSPVENGKLDPGTCGDLPYTSPQVGDIAKAEHCDVSVVIVNHNAGKLLAMSVESVLPEAKEIVVVDSGSSDDSCAALEQLPGFGSTLRLQRNERNVGFSAGCNAGARLATGRFVLFLNPDCVLAPDALVAMVRALEGDPAAGMAGGFLCNADGSEQPGGRRAVPTPWRSLTRAFGLSRFSSRWPRLFSGYDLCTQPVPAGVVDLEAISGACMLVKRDALEDVGPLDEAYFMHCEDLDWCMRFRSKGWKILFVPGAKAVHHAGTCSRSRPLFVEWHKHKGMVRFYRKFFSHQYPGPLLLAVVIGVWMRFAAKATLIQIDRLRNRT